MPPATGPDDLDELDELAAAFVTASRALIGIAIRSVGAAPVEVTLPQHRLLVLLAASGPQGVGEIARELGVNPSNATRICDRLERLDLCERSRSSDDGRAVRVSLTKKGRGLVDAVSAHRQREVSAVLRQLSAVDARTAVAALQAFNQAANERAEREWTVPPS